MYILIKKSSNYNVGEKNKLKRVYFTLLTKRRNNKLEFELDI